MCDEGRRAPPLPFSPCGRSPRSDGSGDGLNLLWVSVVFPKRGTSDRRRRARRWRRNSRASLIYVGAVASGVRVELSNDRDATDQAGGQPHHARAVRLSRLGRVRSVEATRSMHSQGETGQFGPWPRAVDQRSVNLTQASAIFDTIVDSAFRRQPFAVPTGRRRARPAGAHAGQPVYAR